MGTTLTAGRTGAQVSVEGVRHVPDSVRQLGFWSAALATLFSIGYGLTLIVSMISLMGASTETQAGWQGIESYVGSLQPIEMLSLIASLLLVPAFVVLMMSVHYYAAPDKKIWSHLGIAFTLIYATMASINYIGQLTAMRLSTTWSVSSR